MRKGGRGPDDNDEARGREEKGGVTVLWPSQHTTINPIPQGVGNKTLTKKNLNHLILLEKYFKTNLFFSIFGGGGHSQLRSSPPPPKIEKNRESVPQW